MAVPPVAECYAPAPFRVNRAEVPADWNATLERIDHYPERPERVPDTEGHAENAEHGGNALEVARHRTTGNDEAEGCGEQRHGDGGSNREEQQRARSLDLIRDGRDQEQRQAARPADAVNQSDTVRREWGSLRDVVGVP